MQVFTTFCLVMISLECSPPAIVSLQGVPRQVNSMHTKIGNAAKKAERPSPQL